MLQPIAQVWLLVVFAIAGVIAGLAQMHAVRACPCCKLYVGRSEPRCPHCRCRLD